MAGSRPGRSCPSERLASLTVSPAREAGHEQTVLNNASFKIFAGERVAFIGRVGSGKSTIQRLILGLYQPSQGAVLIDGIDARQIDPAELRRAAGFVAQDTCLFYGSLKQNIALGAPFASDHDILAAADVAGVSEFANRHPKGFDMPIGERGESLSGGQRQPMANMCCVLEMCWMAMQATTS